MRNVVDEAVRHNPRRAAPLAFLVLAVLVAGCGGGDGNSEGGDRATAEAAGQPCPVIVDISGWEAFRDMAARMAAGENPADAELLDLAAQPAIAGWIASLEPNVPNPDRMGVWLRHLYRAELGLPPEAKPDRDASDMAGGWNWTLDRRDRVDEAASLLAAPGGPCGLLERLDGWVEPANLPDPLRLYVVPGKPELRWHDGALFVDAAVLIAGSPDQLMKQLAGLVYRNVQAEDGANPLENPGPLAVANTMRILRNEGIGTWLEDLPHTWFDQEHPRLRRVHPVPEHFFLAAGRMIDVLNDRLPPMLADPAVMEARSGDFVRSVAAAGGFNQSGYAMAAVIDANLGNERLQQAAKSVAGFLAAYQEAALLNGDDRPRPGDVGTRPWQSLGPLDEDVFAQVMTIVEANFGPAPQ